MFIYKEDFNKFAEALVETVNYVKTELMPDFDFDAFSHDNEEAQFETQAESAPAASYVPADEVAVAAAPADDSSSVEEWKI